MSIKTHISFSHFVKVIKKLGDVSEELRERFDQTIKGMEERYQRRWGIHMMADDCWRMKENVHGRNCSRNTNKTENVYLYDLNSSNC